MQAHEYKNIFEQEKRHFFYVATHQLVIVLIKRFSQGKNLTILDAGCGTGLLAKKLKYFGKVWGIDTNPLAIALAKKRKVKVCRASITRLPFKNNLFDAVVCIDVLYHRKVKDDTKALREIFRVLRPGGTVILRVPAHKNLRLIHDRYVHTRQRYEKEELATKLQKAGFKIECLSFVGMLLYPLAIVRSWWERVNLPKEQKSAITQLPPFINKILYFLLSWETLVIPRFTLPTGIGLITVCRKPVTA